MAISILFEDDSVLYIDAVTNYTKGHTSNITENRIDRGGVVADHISKNNVTYTLKGVVSSADFQSEYSRSANLLEDFGTQIGSEFRNPASELEISDNSSLLDLLPGSIRQFVTQPDDSVSGDSFRGYSHEVARDRLQRAWDNNEEITILDYNYDTQSGRSVNVRVYDRCYIQNYTDNEDAKTGDSLNFTMSLKRVRLATVKEVEVNTSDQSVSDSAAGKENKGNQTGQDETTGSADEEDAENDLYQYYINNAKDIIYNLGDSVL